ncbi:thermonuclease family protein [Synechococcus elongatus IITB4]|uniref:thermonuclease family protein n=1 Tax=Synechococcus elongatus TaxID=32046 RepID=UPI0030D41D75
MIKPLSAIALLFLLGISGCQSPGRPGEVSQISDGDTLTVQQDGTAIKIRLACIDAPELGQKPWGERARGVLGVMAPVGSEVTVESFERDRYGRTVATVWREGQSVNLEMVRRGWAMVYRQHLRNCDASAYFAAETAARRDRIGYWQAGRNPQPPWEWRRRQR